MAGEIDGRNRHAPGESPAPTPEALDLEALFEAVEDGIGYGHGNALQALESLRAEVRRLRSLPPSAPAERAGELAASVGLLAVRKIWLEWRENGIANAIARGPEYMARIGKIVEPDYPADRLRDDAFEWAAPASPTPGAPRPIKLRAEAELVGDRSSELRVYTEREGKRYLLFAHMGRDMTPEQYEVAYRINSFESTPDPLEGAGEGRQG